MVRPRTLCSCMPLLLLLCTTGPARAELPLLFQGYLEQQREGAPVAVEHGADDPLTLRFGILDGEGADAPVLCQGDDPDVRVSRGYFTAAPPLFEFTDPPVECDPLALIDALGPLSLEVTVLEGPGAIEGTVLGQVPLGAGLASRYADMASISRGLRPCGDGDGLSVEIGGACTRLASQQEVEQVARLLGPPGEGDVWVLPATRLPPASTGRLAPNRPGPHRARPCRWPTPAAR